ncbi:ABC transporter permease [soil metagenome]
MSASDVLDASPRRVRRPTDQTPAERLPSLWRDRAATALWGLIGIVLLVLLWQVIVTVTNQPETTLPSPVAVARSILKNAGLLWDGALVTAREILIGFILAVLVGNVIAVVLSLSRFAERLLYPTLVLLNTVPKVAIAPLIIIWFGFGPTTNAILTLVIAIFPVIVNTTLGLQSCGDDYLRLGRAMGGNGLRLFMKIRVPFAMPSILAGTKLAMTFGTIGAVVGELLAGQAGLGYVAQFSAGQLETPLTFAAIVVLSALGLVLFYLVVIAEYFILRSRRPTP